MVDDSFAQQHIDFVSGYGGSSWLEVEKLVAVGPTCILLRNIAVPWLFPVKNFRISCTRDKVIKLLLDFFITIGLPILSVTVFVDQCNLLLSSLLISCFCFVMFSCIEAIYLKRECTHWQQVWNSVLPITRPVFISYARAWMMVSICICILAVDFKLFPRRLAKTEQFGVSLMDVGVGIVVFVAGLMSRAARGITDSLKSESLKIGPLLLMGAARQVLVALLRYPVHQTEYGTQWNFFYTFAVVKLLCLTLDRLLPLKRSSIYTAVLLLVAYEVCLQRFGLKAYLLVDPANRPADLFSLNREGIVSIIGYMSLHLIGVFFGGIAFAMRVKLKDWMKLVAQFLFWISVFAVLTVLSCRFIDPPSRRLVNLSFVLWMCLLCLFNGMLFLFVELFVWLAAILKLPLYSADADRRNPFYLFEPCLWRAINRFGLLYFLVANVLTGVVNLAVNTLEASDSTCLAILFAYSFFLCTVVALLYAKKSY